MCKSLYIKNKLIKLKKSYEIINLWAKISLRMMLELIKMWPKNNKKAPKNLAQESEELDEFFGLYPHPQI